MGYDVRLTDDAQKDFKKIDRYQAKIITAWLRKNLQGCENPRLYGTPLLYERKGEWRYRVGSYRLIAEIHDNIVLIEIISVRHRREVYD
ncbi:MAG: type II toxin-antitoxin system RelE/ParE family toxin [Defluviitaleaceae bacterium]|nr:type II toxin-antitoxin system RelE/ParE family toxin [Defluviitaleaceae bacterium]